jgi:hypothetical protein
LAASIICFILIYGADVSAQDSPYPWLDEYDSSEALVQRIDVPDGYKRVSPMEGTFAHWLQHLPLKQDGSTVYLYNGDKKANQNYHYAIVDIDRSEQDLMQCADAIIRLRAEYLYSIGEFDMIHFNFTSGHEAKYTSWIEGYRPKVDDMRVNWVKNAPIDSSYEAFREYLDSVFMYAGTYSLDNELEQVKDVSRMRIGDVFIKPGFPGHAIIVVDMAVDKDNGRSLFLLAQGYTPAQDIHIIKNLHDEDLNPWYPLDFGDTLKIPEWEFPKEELKRF